MILQAALLGLVQGLTEFLPVSSSAHLILARAFFGWNSDRFGLAFDVACHLGTLVAVVLYFRRELANMVAAIPAMFSTPLSPDARQLWLIAVGTLPIVAVGLLFNDYIESTLRTPAVATVTLTLGAIGLFAAERIGRGTRTDGSLTAMEAAGIGCAQAAALVPGVSRSGATITLAMLFGLRRDTAARFTFLLSIPAIVAAAGKETPDLLAQGLGGDGAVIFVTGMVVSAVVGYLAVKYFIRYLSGHSLDAFAWYRLALAAITIVWLIAR